MLEHIDGECVRKFFVPNKFLAISFRSDETNERVNLNEN